MYVYRFPQKGISKSSKNSSRYQEYQAPTYLLHQRVMLQQRCPNSALQRANFKVRQRTHLGSIKAPRLKSKAPMPLGQVQRLESNSGTQDEFSKLFIGGLNSRGEEDVSKLPKRYTSGMPNRKSFKKNNTPCEGKRRTVPTVPNMSVLGQRELTSLKQGLHIFPHRLSSQLLETEGGSTELVGEGSSRQQPRINRDNNKSTGWLIEYMTGYAEKRRQDRVSESRLQKQEKKPKPLNINLVRDKIKKCMIKSEYKEKLSQNLTFLF